MNERAEEWVPVSEALRRVEAYEREGLAILGLEAARITGDEKVLLPALAEFAGSTAGESWAIARQVLADDLPADATHVSFVPQLPLGWHSRTLAQVIELRPLDAVG